eukprot:Nk52_evm13s372 gene=Nk52_evmTU13s372
MEEEDSLKAIVFKDGKLEVLDQLKLPHEHVYIPINSVDDGWRVIRDMNVRGAPAIAIVAALSLSVEIYQKLPELDDVHMDEFRKYIHEKVSHLRTSRPTAVNLFQMCDKIVDFLDHEHYMNGRAQDIARFIYDEIEKELEIDLEGNKMMGKYGCEEILKHVAEGENCRILTHCNTGSLATAGYGTALGVVRSVHGAGRIDHVYCTETRPYNQGARLTAYELVYEKIPSTLIADSMVSMLMSTKKITAVVVGADRIVANGDTANKIGTYQIAVSAKYHNIPFYVAAPLSTLDTVRESGAEIVIEERHADEMTCVKGHRIAPEDIGVWNPAFDVTPAALIEGIITEKGIIRKGSDGLFNVKKFIEATKDSISK